MKPLIVLLAGMLMAAHAAAEVNYAGTYTAQGSRGLVTLILTQEADGTLTGSMGNNDTKMLVRAKVQDGRALGTVSNPGEAGSVFFMAQKEGNDVLVLLADMDANGRPREETVRRVPFKAAAAAAPPDRPANPLAAKPAAEGTPVSEDVLVGTFKGDGGRLAVEIQPATDGYAGTIQLEDQRFTFKAAGKDGRLAGSFESQGDSFDFTAVIKGNTLTLKTGSTTYVLEKQRKAVNPLEKRGPANPLEKPAATTGEKPIATGKPAEAADDKWVPVARGKVYKHPTGGVLRYPQDWQVKEADEVLQLIPPNQGTAPEVLYFVAAEDAEGITRPDDPQLIEAAEEQVTQFAPLLRRVGSVESVKSGANAGAKLAWEATGQNGQVIRAHLYITILKGQAVYLAGLGTRQRINQDDPTLREIFSTFAWSEAQIDRELIGVWHYWSYSSSGLGGSGMSSTETRRACTLKADGTFTWEGSTEGYISAANKDSLGEVTSKGAAASKRGSGAKGTWAAGEGKLYLTHDDGTYVAVKYTVKGEKGNRVLYIDSGSAKPQEWTEKRVEF